MMQEILPPMPQGETGDSIFLFTYYPVQFLQKLFHIDFVYPGAMLKFLKIRNLALKAVKAEFIEDGQGLRIKASDLADGHLFGNHGYPLFSVMYSGFTLHGFQFGNYFRFLTAASMRSIPLEMFSMLVA
jgi:hypothetical protein